MSAIHRTTTSSNPGAALSGGGPADARGVGSTVGAGPGVRVGAGVTVAVAGGCRVGAGVTVAQPGPGGWPRGRAMRRAWPPRRAAPRGSLRGQRRRMAARERLAP